ELQAELEPSVLLVPDAAVLRSGQKNTVFVALDGGRFEPRTVVLGPRSENNFYQVLSGLNQGERVVISGQFMLDSESQLREAIQKMLKPARPVSSEQAALVQQGAENREHTGYAANAKPGELEPTDGTAARASAACGPSRDSTNATSALYLPDGNPRRYRLG